MVNVNILTLQDYTCFLQQWDKNAFPPSEFLFVENSKDDIIWDCVVVYEGVKIPTYIKYKKGGLIFISGEPPMSRVYPCSFTKQFDHLITAHPNLNHPHNHVTQQGLNWHYGLSYIQKRYTTDFNSIKNLEVPPKTKLISVITSTQKMMPGHNLRSIIIRKLEEKYSDVIDFYGKGRRFVDDKAEALLPYKFHICMENSYIPDYWTEKFADPIIAYSVPIYAGCKNLKSYFPHGGYFQFDIHSFKQVESIIDSIIENPDEVYQNNLSDLMLNREAILNQYNTIPMIVDFYNRYIKKEQDEKTVNTTIMPSTCFSSYKYLLWLLRIKRLMTKICINTKSCLKI